MIGHVDLYHDLDFASAERNFRAALARGGRATFRIHHDHSSVTFSKSCSGYLSLNRQGVSYQSDSEKRDSFQASSGRIREAAMNKAGFFLPIPKSAPRDSFHITTTSRNYNLVGASKKPKEEAQLILRLLPKGGGTRR